MVKAEARRDVAEDSVNRLDLRLVALGLVASRARAQDLIRRGKITVGGAVALKPSMAVATDALIIVTAEDARRVSRGGEKLSAALDHFAISPAGLVALDIGASTGGFTEVLLERGATKVFAVDVGHSQLAASLGTDPRVVDFQRHDARSLTPEIVPDAIGIVVADVSFISLTLALGAALALAAPGAHLVALVKPQFEAGRQAIGKGGIVRAPEDHDRAVHRVRTWLEAWPGWRVLGIIPSPITGGSGNREFLLAARHDG